MFGIQRVAVMQKSRNLFATLPKKNAPYSLDCIPNNQLTRARIEARNPSSHAAWSYRITEKFAKLLQKCYKNAILII